MFIWDQWPAFFRGASVTPTWAELQRLASRHELILTALSRRTASPSRPGTPSSAHPSHRVRLARPLPDE